MPQFFNDNGAIETATPKQVEVKVTETDPGAPSRNAALVDSFIFPHGHSATAMNDMSAPPPRSSLPQPAQFINEVLINGHAEAGCGGGHEN